MIVFKFFLAFCCVASGVVYSTMGIQARAHLLNPKDPEKNVSWFDMWCFNITDYNKEGQKMCMKGMALYAFFYAGWVFIIFV